MTASLPDRVERLTRARQAALCWGVLGGPLGWLLNLQICYALAERICFTHSRVGVYLTTCASLAMATTAFVASLRAMGPDHLADTELESESAVARFIGSVGLMSSVLFGLIIIAQLIAIGMVDPCAR
jgi:hypothetical protein